MQNLQSRMSAGKIRRYHTAPIIGEQTVGDHTYGVCQILRFILDDNVSTTLLRAALDHDVSEFYTGDIPHPTKKAYPVFYEAIKAVERMVNEQDEIRHELTNKEHVCLKAADWIEAAMFGARQVMLGNDYGLNIMENIFIAFRTLDSAVVPQKAKELIIELENYHVSQ